MSDASMIDKYTKIFDISRTEPVFPTAVTGVHDHGIHLPCGSNLMLDRDGILKLKTAS